MTPPGEKAGRQSVINEVAMQRALVRRVLCTRVPPCMVDDLIQETLLAALRSIDGFRPAPDKPLRDAVRAWLTGIAKNIAKDYLTALARYLRLFCSPDTPLDPVAAREVPYGMPNTEERFGDAEELRVIERLSAKHRDILSLAAQGHTAVEIGARLGICEDTAATRLRYARAAYTRALVRWRR